MANSEINSPEIWAIILAGGESKRMKQPKLLLPFRGKTIIETVVKNVTDSNVDKTMVILGAVVRPILRLISEFPVTHYYNDNYKDGMLSSVKCGFRNLPGELQAVLVFQGDQPLISPLIVNEVINAWRESGKGIVIPVCGGKRGHPILIDRKYRDEIEKLKDEDGLRSLSVKFSDDVLEVAVDSPEILMDIDTQEDYINAINKTK